MIKLLLNALVLLAGGISMPLDIAHDAVIDLDTIRPVTSPDVRYISFSPGPSLSGRSSAQSVWRLTVVPQEGPGVPQRLSFHLTNTSATTQMFPVSRDGISTIRACKDQQLVEVIASARSLATASPSNITLYGCSGIAKSVRSVAPDTTIILLRDVPRDAIAVSVLFSSCHFVDKGDQFDMVALASDNLSVDLTTNASGAPAESRQPPKN